MASMSVHSSWSPFNFKNVPVPLHNVNPDVVNKFNTNNPSNFGSNETNRQWGLSGVSNNVQAAAASALQSGGSRRKKNKNISRQYKRMRGKGGNMSLGHIKRKLSKLFCFGKSKKMRTRTKRRSHKKTRRQRGGQGYQQYMSNVPYTPSYSTGGELSSNMSALANPVPYQVTNNCQDNYNHYGKA
jgi:hypothetical protein